MKLKRVENDILQTRLINKLLKKNLKIEGRIKRKDNYYLYFLENRLVCNFFSYLFDIPYGRKCESIRLPKILKDNKNEKYFWRGIFDTDGYIRKKLKMISLKTHSNALIKDFSSFCEKNNN